MTPDPVKWENAVDGIARGLSPADVARLPHGYTEARLSQLMKEPEFVAAVEERRGEYSGGWTDEEVSAAYRRLAAIAKEGDPKYAVPAAKFIIATHKPRSKTAEAHEDPLPLDFEETSRILRKDIGE